MAQPTLFKFLHPNDYIEGLFYKPFLVNLDRCMGSWNILNDLSNEVCVPNKTEDLNLSVFNTITGTNESRTWTKLISCECKCKFDCRECYWNQKWNSDKCCVSAKIQKSIMHNVFYLES